MTYSILRGTEHSLADNLNGAQLLGPFMSYGIDNLGGRTLIFSSIPQTITFPGALGARVSVKYFCDTLATVTGLLFAVREAGNSQSANPAVAKQTSVAIWHNDGFTLDAAGTANALLLLSAVADTTSLGPVPSEKIKGFGPGGAPGVYIALLSDV